MAEHESFNPHPSPVGPICPTRTDLLDRLADILACLGRAKLELTAAVDAGDQLLCHSAQITVQKLRGDCNQLKAELESHRAQHRC